MKYWYILWMAYAVGTTTLQELFIIVPGTWSTNQRWYTVGGDFFEALRQSFPNNQYQLTWFRWYAQNSNKHRKQAVKEFAHMILTTTKTVAITVIAHSHGANVVLGACQLLAQKKSSRRIQTLYTLGVPVHEEEYRPNMTIIKRLYNLYSMNDPIQTIWGYQRIFESQPNIFNLRVFINTSEPTHEELHSPIIGTWLTMLPLVQCPQQATVIFNQYTVPKITPNPQQESIVAEEIPINLATLFEIRRLQTPFMANRLTPIKK